MRIYWEEILIISLLDNSDLESIMTVISKIWILKRSVSANCVNAMCVVVYLPLNFEVDFTIKMEILKIFRGEMIRLYHMTLISSKSLDKLDKNWIEEMFCYAYVHMICNCMNMLARIWVFDLLKLKWLWTWAFYLLKLKWWEDIGKRWSNCIRRVRSRFNIR